jgi:hypothetical protein
MGERANRPFWVHQLSEYLIGLALIAQGLQDPEPLVPAVVGALIMVNAAAVRGPLGAFKFMGRGVHRWLDVAVMTVVLVGAVQPWVEISAIGRLTMLVVLAPMGFLWFYTDWAERRTRKQRRLDRSGVSGEQVGRTAGRVAGVGYKAARQAIRNRAK